MSQRILITGAARGIGAESARRLAARGHRLALVGLEPEQLQAVAADCGGGALALEADVTDRDALRDAVERAAAELGGLDDVRANAGIGSGAPLLGGDQETWERVIEINLIGAQRTVHAALPHLLASRGYVLTVASLAAIVHGPTLSAYAASKAGVEAFSNALRIELAHRGVDVGVAYFTWIDTEMVRGIADHPGLAYMRGKLRGPFGRTYPLADAADAVVRGIEHRSRIVAAPRWLRALLPLRALLQPLGERDARAAMPEVQRLFEQEAAERGAAASAPTGAGGAAALREPAHR
jgi:NAD(P)-dependent dehydrogenase (short-subunit alcohol dehydrogenase family)